MPTMVEDFRGASAIQKAISGGERRCLFLTDNSPIHLKKSENSLNASKMNVGIGGRQPLMEDGYYFDRSGQKVGHL